jgi:hypothetical protein
MLDTIRGAICAHRAVLTCVFIAVTAVGLLAMAATVVVFCATALLSFAILWPVLVGCCCAVAVGLVALAIVRTIATTSMKIDGNMTRECMQYLAALLGTTTLERALQQLGLFKGINIPDEDVAEMIRLVKMILRWPAEEAIGLDDLRDGRKAPFWLLDIPFSASTYCLFAGTRSPSILVAILAFIRSLSTILRLEEEGGRVQVSLRLWRLTAIASPPSFDNDNSFRIYNISGNPEKTAWYCSLVRNVGKNHGLVAHYNDDGRLVEDVVDSFEGEGASA